MGEKRDKRGLKEASPEQVLLGMLRNLSDERADLKIKYSDHESRIFQNERYIDSVEENGESEFQVFSPRHTVASYKEKTDHLREETQILKEENERLWDRIQLLNDKIREVEEALGSYDDEIMDDYPEEEETDDELEMEYDDLTEAEADGDLEETAEADMLEGYDYEEDCEGEDSLEEWDEEDNPDDDPEGYAEDHGDDYDEEYEYAVDRKFLEIMDIEESEKKNILRDIRENSIQNLYHLVTKMENCSKFTTSDPVRTKLDLDVIISSLGEIINRLEFSVSDMQPVSIQENSFGEKFERLVLYFVQLFPDVHINYDVIREVDLDECNSFVVLKIIKNAIRFYIDYYGCVDIYVLCETKYDDSGEEDSEEGQEYLDIMIADHEIDVERMEEYQVMREEDYEFDFLIMQRRVDVVEGFFELYSLDEYRNVVHITAPVR